MEPLFFLPGVDASHDYVRAWALGCFHSPILIDDDLYNSINTQTFWRALTTSVDIYHRDKECPFSGITKSGRVWRKVPESDAWSVGLGIWCEDHECTTQCTVYVCEVSLVVTKMTQILTIPTRP